MPPYIDEFEIIAIGSVIFERPFVLKSDSFQYEQFKNEKRRRSRSDFFDRLNRF